MTIVLTKTEYAKMQDIITTYENIKISKNKYLNKNREEIREKNKIKVYNRYHTDSEYREKKIETMKLYNAKKKAEKNNVRQET